MVGKFFSTLGRIGHTCSEFGNYFANIQRDCLKSGKNNDCEGDPTPEDARKDFQKMMRSRHSNFTF